MKELTAALGALVACAATTGLGFVVIPFLKRLKFGQTIREDGPKWHHSKEGTPTMGGVLIIAGVLIGLVIAYAYSGFSGGNLVIELGDSLKMTTLFSGVGLALGMGLIGFLDDYIKVVKKRNLGLTPRQKTLLQLLVAAAYLSSLGLAGMNTTWLPFVGDIDIMSGAGLLFWPIALLFIYGFANAVNLTDGIDGLASSVTLVVSCAFMLASGYFSFSGINTLAAVTAGACIGFLLWNAHPAKVFMGDTGSLFLGGMVVALSFGIGRPILLLPAGIIYLIEAGSVILQVAYYKKTKKRIFKMSPLHHHFEMSGWSEEKIVFIFSFVTLIGCILALLPIFLQW